MARISLQLYSSTKTEMRSFDRESSVVARRPNTNKILCSNVSSSLECGASSGVVYPPSLPNSRHYRPTVQLSVVGPSRLLFLNSLLVDRIDYEPRLFSFTNSQTAFSGGTMVLPLPATSVRDPKAASMLSLFQVLPVNTEFHALLWQDCGHRG
jgi:hypothetical protein